MYIYSFRTDLGFFPLLYIVSKLISGLVSLYIVSMPDTKSKGAQLRSEYQKKIVGPEKIYYCGGGFMAKNMTEY